MLKIRRDAVRLISSLLLLLFSLACEREERRFHALPAAALPSQAHAEPRTDETGVPRGQPGPFDQNAWGIAQGQHLFTAFNCNGCHAQGGGGMGPALIDGDWIYGHEAEDIYRSIVHGRPDGMPAFGDKLTETQAWQLVAFVRSLGGMVPKDAAPGRPDLLSGPKAPNRRISLLPKEVPR